MNILKILLKLGIFGILWLFIHWIIVEWGDFVPELLISIIPIMFLPSLLFLLIVFQKIGKYGKQNYYMLLWIILLLHLGFIVFMIIEMKIVATLISLLWVGVMIHLLKSIYHQEKTKVLQEKTKNLLAQLLVSSIVLLFTVFILPEILVYIFFALILWGAFSWMIVSFLLNFKEKRVSGLSLLYLLFFPIVIFAIGFVLLASMYQYS